MVILMGGMDQFTRQIVEMDPGNWTGRIVNPQSEERSICHRSDVSIARS